MSVEVDFLGVCLFQIGTSNNLIAVHFPDAGLGQTPKDGYEASEHVPMLLGLGQFPLFLKGKHVEVCPANSPHAPWKVTNLKDELASARYGKGKELKLDLAAPRATMVTLHGPTEDGKVETWGKISCVFAAHAGKQQTVYPGVTLTYPGAVFCSIDGASPITVKDGHITFAHLDTTHYPGDLTPTEGEKDPDFRWVYSLMRPAGGGSFEDWLKEKPAGLPAPHYETKKSKPKKHGRWASVSTCFPGWI